MKYKRIENIKTDQHFVTIRSVTAQLSNAPLPRLTICENIKKKGEKGE